MNFSPSPGPGSGSVQSTRPSATAIKVEKYYTRAIQFRFGKTYHQAGFLGALVVAPIRIAFLPVPDQAGLRFQVLRADRASLLSKSVVSRGEL